MGDEKKARWLENYVKHNIQSRGVGIPQIRELVQQTAHEYALPAQPVDVQKDFLDDLMRQPFTEDKLAAVLYLQLYGQRIPADRQLGWITYWLDQGRISDWNVCDWLCVRVLSPMVDVLLPEILPVLESWNSHPYLWTARASLVPFAQCTSIADHGAVISSFSSVLIRREERFCKTSVGWVMREFSRHDPDFVLRFLKDHEAWTTPEVVRNAKKYMAG